MSSSVDANTTAGLNVTVRRHPFDSPEARCLIPLLEADLAAFYPDWDELVHPGMHHENNPRPPAETIMEGGQGNEYKDALETPNMHLEPRLLHDQSSGLFFFVAFASNSSASTELSGGLAREEAIGCGALRLLPSKGETLPTELDPSLKYAEVKRMYVHSSYRGQGISKIILAELERFARDVLHLDTVVIEVGLRQGTAVKLYRGAGYVERAMFGEYVGSDPASGGDSCCMEKALR